MPGGSLGPWLGRATQASSLETLTGARACASSGLQPQLLLLTTKTQEGALAGSSSPKVLLLPQGDWPQAHPGMVLCA